MEILRFYPSCIFAPQLLIFKSLVLFELIICPRSIAIANQGPSPSEETDAHTSNVDDDKDLLVMKRLTAMLVVLMRS